MINTETKSLRVKEFEGQLVTESRQVAKMIGKRHSDLMRDIRGYKQFLDKNPTLDSVNFFIETDYKDKNSQTRPCYLLTEKGCGMVANMMTGEKGVLFTAEYLDRFEEMEKDLNIEQVNEEKDNDLQIFNFENNDVRTVVVEGEPWFVLKDLCNILELGHVATVTRRLEDDVVSKHPIQDSLGRTQLSTFVSEDGLYDVILDSRKPEAKKFRKWITSEVIPSIRKHGGYLTPSKLEEVLLDPDVIINLATSLKEERAKKQELMIKNQQQQQYIEENKDNTEFGKMISEVDDAVNIGTLAKMISRHPDPKVDIGRNRLFSWLRSNGYLIKSGAERNTPMQRYINAGWFIVHIKTDYRYGDIVETPVALVTGKGQVKLMNIVADYLMGK